MSAVESNIWGGVITLQVLCTCLGRPNVLVRPTCIPNLSRTWQDGQFAAWAVGSPASWWQLMTVLLLGDLALHVVNWYANCSSCYNRNLYDNVGTTNHQETCWYQGKVMDFHSEGSEFDPMSNLCAEFSAQKLASVPLAKTELWSVRNVRFPLLCFRAHVKL